MRPCGDLQTVAATQERPATFFCPVLLLPVSAPRSSWIGSLSTLQPIFIIGHLRKCDPKLYSPQEAGGLAAMWLTRSDCSKLSVCLWSIPPKAYLVSSRSTCSCSIHRAWILPWKPVSFFDQKRNILSGIDSLVERFVMFSLEDHHIPRPGPRFQIPSEPVGVHRGDTTRTQGPSEPEFSSANPCTGCPKRIRLAAGMRARASFAGF